MINKYYVKYNNYKTKKINVDLSRGRPSKEQLDLSIDMFNISSTSLRFVDESGFDIRNYGELGGTVECKKLMSSIIDMPIENILLLGNSSLKIMHDQISRSFTHGICGETPWCKLDKVKWLCPVPGYDRHFSITEHFGIEMINIPLNDDGPDMDLIEELIQDSSVKGIWCVPKYSNPSGIIYSNEVIKRFANLNPTAKDFRIYWDNAYALHGFDDDLPILNLYNEALRNKKEDMVYIFTSTSKITFPGSGVACIGASDKNINDIFQHIKNETICYDKINEIRHALYFKKYTSLREHMHKHGQILKKKFEFVNRFLNENLGSYATWSKPKGGYFVLLKVDGIAKEVILRCADCGVKLTEAGSTHPYKFDPTNSYIRLAPSFVSEEELTHALQVLCLSIKIESLLKK